MIMVISKGFGCTEHNNTTCAYTDTDHIHAVIIMPVLFTGTSLSDGSAFSYDANGNMTTRDYDNAEYIQKFDVENRLVAITDTQTLSVTQFVYDGDGSRVKTIYPDGSWTAFIGDHYEVESDGVTRSYYFLGAQRIAMRIDYGETDTLYFFHTDHPSAALRADLGSTSLLSDENGDYVDGTEARYLPYGGYRVEPTAELTDHGFTGHKQQDEVGL
ncbi:MAG: hypothetical protein JXA42_08285 [Anaerolineales bacterium]|nr:hypothetical protein [Anaerolineales bacterium]